MPQVIPYVVGSYVSTTAYAGWAAFATVVTSAIIPEYGKAGAARRARMALQLASGQSLAAGQQRGQVVGP
jgi:hypothetical protein